MSRETYPVVTPKSIKNFQIEPGIYDLSFPMNDQEEWNMSISIPEISDQESVPLVIALHWAGDGQTYLQYSECLAFPAFAPLNAIVVAPSSDGLHWIHPSNEARVIDLIRKITKHWPVLKDRVVITGYSNGAIGSWDYVKKYPNLFCAALPVAGSYEAAKMKVPLYVIHGAMDDLFKVEEVAAAMQASVAKNSQIDFQIISDYSHYMACAYAEALREKVLKMKSELFDE